MINLSINTLLIKTKLMKILVLARQKNRNKPITKRLVTVSDNRLDLVGITNYITKPKP